MLSIRPLVFCALPLLLLACGGPSRHDTLVNHGREAEARENWVEAARMYEEACALKPAATATCRRAQQMREYAVEIRTFRARGHCSEGRLRECLEALEPVRALNTTNQSKVQEVLSQASGLAINRCASPSSAARELKSGLAELRCLQGWQKPLWDAPSYRKNFAQRSRYLAASLTGLANGLPDENVGARMSFLEAASCLVRPGDKEAQALRSARERFAQGARTRLQVQYTVRGSTRPAPGTCTQLASSLKRGLTCQDIETLHPGLRLGAEVFSVEPRWQRRHSDRSEVARYRAGTETVPNPEYDRLRVEYELADQRLRDVEGDVRERENKCNETQTDADCNALDAIRRDVASRRNEMERARQDFHSTSATITQDVFKDHHYTVRTHRWSAPYRASLALGAGAASPEVTTIDYTDVEQSGFAEAGIRSDAFEPPAPNYFRDQGSRWLVTRLEARITSELGRRAKERMERCRGNRIECWATANYWLGNTSFGKPLLEQLADGQGALQCTAASLVAP